MKQQTSQLSRRELLRRSSAGFGNLALMGMLASTTPSRAASNAPSTSSDDKTLRSPLAAHPGHFAPRAKRVIFLFIHGGPSQVDTFDYKPLLQRDTGKPLPFAKPRVQFAQTGNLLASPWKFKQHGQCGAWVSDLFPQIATQVDNLCFVKSLHGSNEAHGGALLKVHTGSDTFVRPSMGSWISYGLGTENENLPSYITMSPTSGHGGVNNYASAFLPAVHHGTAIHSISAKTNKAEVECLGNDRIALNMQRAQLDLLGEINRDQLARTGPDAALEARIESFELAFRMQTQAPELLDLTSETDATKQLYGLDQANTAQFARQCLLARRLSEKGVRFVQCSHGYWDQHSNLKNDHAKLAAEIDQPVAGLIADLKQRGMLDETLLIWGGEFGRTPTAQGGDGRDHNPHGFTWFFAGGGTKPGFSYGATDDYGFYAAQDKVHIHDLHATLLHLLGLNHEALTYRYAGRDFRLTDVAGHVVRDILA